MRPGRGGFESVRDRYPLKSYTCPSMKNAGKVAMGSRSSERRRRMARQPGLTFGAMQCTPCGTEYLANSTEAFQRKCPKCQEARRRIREKVSNDPVRIQNEN